MSRNKPRASAEKVLAARRSVVIDTGVRKAPDFPDLLRLIDERSTAFRAAVAAAPSLDVPVPTCPDWTLFDLMRHLGEGRRAWAATVAAGPDAPAKATPHDDPAVPREREALLAWSAASAQQLLD